MTFVGVYKRMDAVLSIPRSIYLNWRLFGFPYCLKHGFPILFGTSVKCVGMRKGGVIVRSPQNFGIRYGLKESGSVGIAGNSNGYFVLGSKGTIVFHGDESLSQGIGIRVDSGTLKFGRNFSCNKNCFISCSEGVTFGDDVLLGWNINVRDSDGHEIRAMQTGQCKENCKPVWVGDQVWIASHVDLLKGAVVPNHSVVAYRSCVLKEFTQEHTLIGGFPAKVLEEDIIWKK